MPAFLLAAAIPVAYLDAAAEDPPLSGRTRVALSKGWPIACAAISAAIAGLLVQGDPGCAAGPGRGCGEFWQLGCRGRACASRRGGGSRHRVIPVHGGVDRRPGGSYVASAAYFERVATQSDLPEAWLNLAAEQAQLGRSPKAITSLGRALRIGYQRPVVAMPAGDLALRLGRPDIAHVAFVAALLRAPSLAGDPWWATQPDRSDALSRAVAEASEQTSGATRWELLLMAGLTADARAVATNDPTRLFAIPLIDAWEGDRVAGDALVQQCLANPLDLYTLLWCPPGGSPRKRPSREQPS